MPTKDGDYWAERRKKLLAQMEGDEAKLNAKLERLYASEAAKLEREIAAYYQRHGEKNVIEYRRLLASLDEADRALLIERMEEFGRKHPQWAHLLPVRETIYQLNELEGIQTSIRMHQLEIGAIEQEELEAHFEAQALRSANLAAEQLGFGSNFYTVNAAAVAATVGQAWSNEKSYSERVWDNREKLAAYLNDDFGKLIARGVSYDQCVKELSERFEAVSKRDMHRLVFTEGTFVFNEAHAQVLSQEFGEYTLLTAGDGRVCKICRDIAEQTAKSPVRYEDRKPGVNFPPLHPWCRCDTAPHVEDWDAWIDERTAGGVGSATPKGEGKGGEGGPQTFAERLHSLSTDEVVAATAALDKLLNFAWQLYRKQKTSSNYENTVGVLIDSYSGDGFLTAESGAKIAGKELQLASWLSAMGRDVRFLYAPSEKGSHTPDILLDGVPWEMKRVESPNPNKIKTRINEAKLQSGSIIIDLSVSEISIDDASKAVWEMMDDPKIEKIVVIKDGEAFLFEK